LAERQRVAFSKDELPDGSRKVIAVGRREIVVVNGGGRLFAVFNRCPHQQAPLSAGALTGAMLPTTTVGDYAWGLDGGVLRCPWHKYEFDLSSGRCLADPERYRVATYEVREEGDEIAVYV
jgi:nitrite reductase (NADH) small subunit